MRALEEELCLSALEAAMNDVRRLDTELETAAERARMGRELVYRSSETGEVLDRSAGLAEVRMAERVAQILKDNLEDAQEIVEVRRAEYLASRVERRQAEVLLQSERKREEVELARRLQQGVEDWDRARRIRGTRTHSSASADET